MTIDLDLTSAERPRDVVTAAGRWLAEALDGFDWLSSRRLLRRRVGALTHQVALSPSSYNRAGESIMVWTYVGARDAAYGLWRAAHPDLVTAPEVRTDLYCAHMLGYATGRANGYTYGSSEDGDIDLTDPGSRGAALEAFVAKVREGVLPWFDEASDPDRIVDSVPGRRTTRPVSVVEWLASRDRLDLIDAYAERFRNPPDRWEAGVTLAKSGAPAPGMGDDLKSMGWSVTRILG
ncbi:hypothetical protein [Asanoa siamensis]|uniref:Uncharacterized protein n=1 Tax=Asanoa siamensis TaxID=926357 RepID=A0ABQ4D1X5_9ACTN|nr:hypothetical protein [Asanoa siamensis]GIF77529.1 hypothetical protein Asi02nite_70470 [Asanoa siamensis]